MARKVIFKKDQTSEQLAYLAGIIDGEGCFYMGLTHQAKYGNGYMFHTFIKVTSCDRVLIDWLDNLFGGTREERYRWTSKKAFERPVYNWQATGEMLDYVCPKILPYLVIKTKQCELMMKMRETYANIGSKRLSEEVVNLRKDLIDQNRKLNSRFHNHPSKQ